MNLGTLVRVIFICSAFDLFVCSRDCVDNLRPCCYSSSCSIGKESPAVQRSQRLCFPCVLVAFRGSVGILVIFLLFCFCGLLPFVYSRTQRLGDSKEESALNSTADFKQDQGLQGDFVPYRLAIKDSVGRIHPANLCGLDTGNKHQIMPS